MDFSASFKFRSIKKFAFEHPFLSVGLLHAILITIYSLFTFFWGSGHIVFIDLTEGINLSDASDRIYYSYANNWGEAIAEKQRVVPFTLMWVLFKILHLGEANFVPFRILFGYYLSIIGFVFMLSSFKSRSLKAQEWFLLAAIFASTAFYLYNPWMTNRILHNFLYFSPFTVTMHLGLLYRCLFKNENNRWFYLMLLLNGVLLGTFMTTPHTALLVLIPTTLLIILALINGTYLRTFIYVLLVPILAVLHGLYWILPFLLYKPIPDRVESISILDLLSQKASIINVLKLQGYWWDRILPGYFPDSFSLTPGASFMFGILYLIPCLFLGYGIYYYRKLKISYFIGFLFAISIFLSSYTFLSKDFYEFIMFKTSISDSIGWLFREIEKFSYLTVLSYAIGIFLVFNIKNIKLLRTFYVFFVILFILNFAYLFRYTQMNLRKVSVPNDYEEINRIMLRDSSQFNIAYYPQVQFLKWSPSIDSSNYISNLSSNKPALPNVEGDSYTKYYINTVLDSSMVDHIDVGDALNSIGIKYLIIRNDMRGRDVEELLYSLEKQDSLLRLWGGEYLTVYQNKKFNGLLEVRNKRLVTNLGLNYLESFAITGESLASYFTEYTDLNTELNIEGPNVPTSFLFDIDGPLDLSINKYKSGFVYPSDFVNITNPSSSWALTSLSNKTHAENELYFNNFNITARPSNYGKEVLISLGGLHLNEDFIGEFKNLNDALIFPKNDLFQIVQDPKNGNTISYKGEEKDYVWNIYRTNKLNVADINAIGVEGLFEGMEFLEPHIKFYYYDQNLNSLGVQVFYPELNKFSGVFKVPRGVSYVDFSIWVRGKGAGKVAYTLKNLKVYDVGTKYFYPQLTVPVQNVLCQADCALYARVLESSNYPAEIEVIVDKVSKNILKNTRTGSKYRWVKVSDLAYKDKYDVTLVNLSGFNSIAALAVVNKLELESEIAKKEEYLNSEVFEKFLIEDKTFYRNKLENTFIKSELNEYVYYSPVKYSFNAFLAEKANYLIFKKPSKPGWELTCGGKRASQIGSISAAWQILEGENNCEIYYIPQSYYLIGLRMSLAALFTSFSLAFLLAFYKNKTS
jgi:hypothetical protein